MEPGLVVLVIVIGYVIGSFPTAYLVARTKGVDIFAVGSGNMGATNVTRAVGMRYGLLVWLIDGVKGILAILLARLIVPDYQTTASVLAAVSAVAGHNWSLLATLLTGSIRGGKGAATAMGTFLLLAPTLLVALVLAVAMTIVLLTRYVSLGVLTAVAVAGIAFLVLVMAGWMDPVYTVYLLAGWMVFVRHRGNIVRLLAGTERRLGERA
ncbi:MAG: glycerol-3-phosphate acyltransferase [Anaerolineae bacterium]|mgnify:FL=1|nr:glycerol-3-phosphate acyltransferase [Anaerolineae bacterium]